jgi:uncharacterized protein YdbL (DUF1318 family)
MQMRSGVKAVLAAAALMALGAPAFAQGDWKAERAAGRIGEQPDGYLAVVSGGSPALEKMVADVNALRREKYFAGAGSQTPAAFAQITACNVITGLQPNEMYKTPGGQWRQRGTGTPELAAICPR